MYVVFLTWAALVLLLIAGPVMTHFLLLKRRTTSPRWLSRAAKTAGKANLVTAPFSAMTSAAHAAGSISAIASALWF